VNRVHNRHYQNADVNTQSDDFIEELLRCIKQAVKRSEPDKISNHREVKDKDEDCLGKRVQKHGGQDKTEGEISCCQEEQKGLLDDQMVFKIFEKDKVSFVTIHELIEEVLVVGNLGLFFDSLIFLDEKEVEAKTD